MGAKFDIFRTWLKKSWRLLKWTLLILLVLVVAIDLWLSFLKYPKWLRDAIGRKLAPPGGEVQIGRMRGGLFTDIRCSNIRVVYPTEVGNLHVNIDELNLDLAWLPTLTGYPEFDSFSVRNVTAELRLPDGESLQAAPVAANPLRVHGANIAAHVSESEALEGTYTFTFHDVTVHGRLVFQHGDDLLPMLIELPVPTEPPPIDPALCAKFRKTQQELANFSLGANDTFIHADLNGDILNAERIRASGDFGMSLGILSHVIIPKARGRFECTLQHLKLQDLQLFLSFTELIRGDAVIDIDRKVCSAQIEGSISPYTVLGLADQPTSALPPWIAINNPVRFHAVLPETPLDMTQALPTLDFSCDNIHLGPVPIRHTSGKLHYDAARKELRLRDLLLAFDYLERRTITGSAALDLGKNLLSADLDGTLDLPNLLDQFGVSASTVLLLNDFNRLAFHLSLAPSPLDYRLWKLGGRFQLPPWRLHATRFGATTADFSIDHCRLHLTSLATSLDATAPNRLEATADTDLNTLLSPQETSTIQFTTRITSGAPAPVQALDATGKLLLNLKNDTIALPALSGTCHPEALNALLQKPLGLDDDSPLAWIRCRTATPGRFTLEAPPVSFDNLGAFILDGHAILPDGDFLAVPFDQLEATLRIDQNSLDFQRLSGNSPKVRFQMGLRVEFTPLLVKISQLDYLGDPAIIEPFLFSDAAKEIYRELWTKVAWAPEKPPHFLFPELLFQSAPDLGGWKFLLKGTGEAQDVTYAGMTFSKAHCRLNLDLPDKGLQLTDLALATKGQPPLVGDVTLQFGDILSGTFHAAFPEGQLDLLGLLRSAVPDLVPLLDGLVLAPDTHFQCQGSFSTGTTPRIRLSATVETPRLQHYGIECTNLKGNWNATEHSIHWNIPNAAFYGGTITSTGTHDFQTNHTRTLAIAKNVPLAEIARAANLYLDGEKTAPEGSTPLPAGQLDCDLRLDLYQNWADTPIYLEGHGQINIHDADLWRVPHLTTLGQMLSIGNFSFFSKDKISNLGRISRLHAELEFLGDRILFPRIATNGTIIALYGQGEYNLSKNLLQFLVSGEFLQSASIISWLFKPISWAFEAEITGSPTQYQWTLHTFLNKLFGTGGNVLKDTDPAPPPKTPAAPAAAPPPKAPQKRRSANRNRNR